MQIYGLFGQSGSGKSYVAQYIAQECNADWIIDDGLLIWQGHIIAGESAKFEKTKMGAVKRAIFSDPKHKAEVEQALAKLPADSSILVIGTSQKMIQIICDNLDLPGTVTWIPIENMIDKEAISLAQNLRQYGMHAIPINETKIEETRMGRLLARIRFGTERHSDAQHSMHQTSRDGFSTGRGWSSSRANSPGVHSNRLLRTIVNPPFSGGAIHIHPRAIRDSILYLVSEQKHPVQIDKVTVEIGDIPSIHLRVRVKYGFPIQALGPSLLTAVRTYLSNYLGLSLVYVELVVSGIIL